MRAGFIADGEASGRFPGGEGSEAAAFCIRDPYAFRLAKIIARELDVAGLDGRSTMGGTMGVAWSGNAGLLSIARLLAPSSASPTQVTEEKWFLRTAALVTVVVFATIRLPGLRL